MVPPIPVHRLIVHQVRLESHGITVLLFGYRGFSGMLVRPHLRGMRDCAAPRKLLADCTIPRRGLRVYRYENATFL